VGYSYKQLEIEIFTVCDDIINTDNVHVFADDPLQKNVLLTGRGDGGRKLLKTHKNDK
jgi:hypothetical protein